MLAPGSDNCPGVPPLGRRRFLSLRLPRYRHEERVQRSPPSRARFACILKRCVGSRFFNVCLCDEPLTTGSGMEWLHSKSAAPWGYRADKAGPQTGRKPKAERPFNSERWECRRMSQVAPNQRPRNSPTTLTIRFRRTLTNSSNLSAASNDLSTR
jgi:hypothetical protein